MGIRDGSIEGEDVVDLKGKVAGSTTSVEFGGGGFLRAALSSR